MLVSKRSLQTINKLTGENRKLTNVVAQRRHGRQRSTKKNYLKRKQQRLLATKKRAEDRAAQKALDDARV